MFTNIHWDTSKLLKFPEWSNFLELPTNLQTLDTSRNIAKCYHVSKKIIHPFYCDYCEYEYHIIWWLPDWIKIGIKKSRELIKIIKNILDADEIYHKDSIKYLFENIPLYIKNDKKCMIKAIKLYSDISNYISSKLYNDVDFCCVYVKLNPRNINKIPDIMYANKTVALNCLSCHNNHYLYCYLQYFSTELQDDKEVVLAAVTRNGQNILFASIELQNDKDVALAAIKHNRANLSFLSNKYTNDKNFVLIAIKYHRSNINYISDILKIDHEVMIMSFPKIYNPLSFWDCNNKLVKTKLYSFMIQQSQSYKSIKYFKLFFERINHKLKIGGDDFNIYFNNMISYILGINFDTTTLIHTKYTISNKLNILDGNYWLTFKNAYLYCKRNSLFRILPHQDKTSV